ncbi:MAG: SIR2 family protein [Candidatus Solibacter sp.]
MGDSLTNPVSPAAAAVTPETGPQPPYELMRDRMARGLVIPFLGAGASLLRPATACDWSSPSSGFLPKAWELAEYLDRRSGYPSNAPPELTRVAQYFEGVAGRQGLDDELREVFAKAYTPGPLHLFLAASKCRVLVTTNYDCLLEKAFEAGKRSYHLVVYRNGAPTLFYGRYDGEQAAMGPRDEVVPNELVIPKDGAPIIYKMHGSADLDAPERDSYLITEDDYVQFLSRMVANTAIPSLFAEPFKTSHMLFLGYGLQDWNLRVILHKIWQEWPSRRAAWAIQHKALPLEKEFWSRRQLTIYEKTIDELLVHLMGNSDAAQG